MKRPLAVVALAALALSAVLVARAWRGAPPPAAEPVAQPIAVDRDAAVAHFAEALTYRTISHGADSGVARDDAAFDAFRSFLARSYPRAHAALRREIVARHTPLYTWPGSDPSLEPILLIGHYDVVPVDARAVDRWTHPAFGGVVSDGFLWGRGSFDDKINVIALLEAVEALVARGFEPTRSVLLAFGHDEELGGGEGAAAVAATLAQRGVRAALVLDEGGAVAGPGMIPGLERPTAAVGIAEKGYVSVELVAEAEGGHSSAPPRHTAIGIVATAIHRLERDRMPTHFAAMRSTLESIGPHLPFGYRLVTQNLWLFGPLLEPALSRVQLVAPMLRTTTAATIIEGGVKDNVLPNEARAVVNFRILPGDTIDGVVEHVRRVVDDDRIRLTLSAKRREASPVTSLDSPAWALLRGAIADHFPDAVAVPFLIPGGTDARRYRRLSDGVFGFVPVRAEVDDMKRAHGNDERIGVDAYLGAIGFYADLIERASAWR